MSISASEARKTLYPLIERVNADHDAVEIVSRKGSAVLMPADEYAAWQETAYLFRSPANARPSNIGRLSAYSFISPTVFIVRPFSDGLILFFHIHQPRTRQIIV